MFHNNIKNAQSSFVASTRNMLFGMNIWGEKWFIQFGRRNNEIILDLKIACLVAFFQNFTTVATKVKLPICILHLVKLQIPVIKKFLFFASSGALSKEDFWN